ncbi:MAG: hypothetical protein FWC47_05540 [Oscillospiraceae bacterium]|nr:hypothetical protein [Oscillospiraceae bacterium]
MNNEWDKVKEFHEKFGHPKSEKPIFINAERARARYNWMLEEINEFLDASNIVDQVDAMIDLMYFALGTMVEIGVKPDKIFDIVHNANMAKLWNDGLPHFDKDGKTIKPSTWNDPYEKIELEIKNSL